MFWNLQITLTVLLESIYWTCFQTFSLLLCIVLGGGEWRHGCLLTPTERESIIWPFLFCSMNIQGWKFLSILCLSLIIHIVMYSTSIVVQFQIFIILILLLFWFSSLFLIWPHGLGCVLINFQTHRRFLVIFSLLTSSLIVLWKERTDISILLRTCFDTVNSW